MQTKAYYNRGPVLFGNPTLSSNPAPGATITGATPVGTPANSTLRISNTGSGGPALSVSAPTLGGAGANSFSVSPVSAFSLGVGAPAQVITIQCNPTAPGTFRASLNYTTNDPAQPGVSYNLVCTGLTPRFNSAPYQPGATITLSGQVNQSNSLTFSISNAGGSGTNLIVNSATLSQTLPGVFTVTPTTTFNLSQGSPARVVTVTCTPPAAGSYIGTLNFPVANDPDLTNATYNLVCKGLKPLVVTSPANAGAGLTLSTALTTYLPDQQIIVFAVPGNLITLNGVTLPVVNRGPVIIDGGGCNNGQPALTIDGGGANGLNLGAGVQIRNIRIKGFSGNQLVTSGGGNKLGNCVVVSRL